MYSAQCGVLAGGPGQCSVLRVHEYLVLMVTAMVADPPRLSLTVMVPGFVKLRIPAFGDTLKLLRMEPSCHALLSVNVPICWPLEVAKTV